MNASGTTRAPIAIGTSGYSFVDWVGTFYPLSLPKNLMLDFYARHFSIVEINASYYRLLPPRIYESILKRVGPEFEFTTKLLGDFTHKPGLDLGLVKTYLETLKPLTESGQNSCLLAQFPYAFRNNSQNRDKILAMGDCFHEQKLAVEFRNDTWHHPETFEFLEQNGLIYVTVDEPSLRGLMPPTARATAGLGYVRLHGRNAETWWNSKDGDRYLYNYSEEELREWLPKIDSLLKSAGRTVVFFNNCHLGHAARNAKLLQKLLSDE